jgi:predicted lipoprotein
MRTIGYLLSIVLIPVLFFALGCQRDAGAPAPLPVEQIASEFDKGFKDAKQEVKDLAKKVVDAVQAKDYPAAHVAVQELSSAPGATKNQQTLAARAFVTITGLLQTAQSQGDEKAGTVLKTYQGTK